MFVNKNTFKLKNYRACIRGMKLKERYIQYQNDYKDNYFVFPELDRIHTPFTAKWSEVYDLFCTLRKSGILGALYCHDLHHRFHKRIRKVYESYGKEWSFLVTLLARQKDFLSTIENLPNGEYIHNNLGYKMDSQGNYYEGTWENGSLVYGLVYVTKSNQLYVGSFHDSGKENCCGVCATVDFKSNQIQITQTSAGQFRFVNTEFSLYEGNALILVEEWKKGRLIYKAITGSYDEGYEEGTFLFKTIGRDIRISWIKYKEGEIKSRMHLIAYFLRGLMAWPVFAWFVLKYIHGTVFLITPLYYSIRKKNWRV